jgi:hypothetical protein
MAARFCPTMQAAGFKREIGNDLPLSQAEIQNRLLRIAA